MFYTETNRYLYLGHYLINQEKPIVIPEKF
jgi:hypothetical protein